MELDGCRGEQTREKELEKERSIHEEEAQGLDGPPRCLS